MIQPESIMADTGKVSIPEIAAPAHALPAAPAGERYRFAMASLKKRDYDTAEKAFTEFLRDYPDDAQAPNAQYWLGMAHYSKQDYKQAATNFIKLYKRYPESDKVAEGLVNLSTSLHAMGRKEAACSALKHLQDKYPAASPLVTQKAKRRREVTGCP